MGTVVVQAPEHEVENLRAVAKAGDDPKKIKKIQTQEGSRGVCILERSDVRSLGRRIARAVGVAILGQQLDAAQCHCPPG